MKKTIKNKYPNIVTIAGSDPSGGAGIQADIKAISATGGYAAAIITVLTAQNTQGVQSIYELPPAFIKEQFQSVFSDLKIKAIKIGMLWSAEIVELIALLLQMQKCRNIVLDPVMVATSGDYLISDLALTAMKTYLMPEAYLITPNIAEAERLWNKAIPTTKMMERAAIQIGNAFCNNVLVKGGHMPGDVCRDVLYLFEEDECHWFEAPRVHTTNTHGTGCTLSSAIASYLGQGFPLIDAVAKAKQYLTAAIQQSHQLKVGKGNGPINHFYFL